MFDFDLLMAIAALALPLVLLTGLITHVHTRQFSSDGTAPVSGSITVSDNKEQKWIGTLADSTTDEDFELTVDTSKLKSVYMKSDQTVTIETNNATSPTDTITLTANQPLSWTVGEANPLFSADVTTGFFVTNSSGSTANISIYLLENAP